MRLPSWLRPFATHLNLTRKRRARPRPAFRPRLEMLEERTLLSNYTAGTVTELIGDINAANAAGGTNTITLTAASSSPYILDDTTGALPEITVNDNLTINTIDGANRTIERSSSASAFRLFTVDSGASLTLQNLTLTNGWADGTLGTPGVDGGAIFNAGILSINFCTLAHNTAEFDGGGIYNIGTVNVSNSALANNETTRNYGGGICNDEDASATANVYNSTLTSNYAGTYYGGLDGSGIFNGRSDTLNVYNSTIVDGNDIYNVNSGTCQLGNSIVEDVRGAVSTSLGHNLIEFDSAGFTNGINGDIVGVDPMLASLGNYGGPTQTMGLLPGSPAIDAGNNALVPAGITTDQRGQPRIIGGTVDIGAFESQGFTLTATSGSTQSTPVNAYFPSVLTVTVTPNDPLDPVDGGVVTFAAPSSGASATLSYTYPSPGTIRGGSESVNAVANDTIGAYTVTASIGGATTPVDFSLTNGRPTAIITSDTPLATDASRNWTSPEGSPIFLTGDSFLDPNGTDLPSGITFTWSVTKNGAAYQSGTGQQYSFTPDDRGTYVVTLDVTDADGSGSVSQTFDVTSALTAHIRTPAGFTAEPAGAFDPNFGSGGQMSTEATGYNLQGNVLAQQPDGKIVSAGYVYISQDVYYLAIARYLSDGTPDPSFGQNGVVVTDLGHDDMNVNSPSLLLVQPDGKILIDVTSNYGMALLRLNPDGSPDISFGPANTGIVDLPLSFQPTSVVLQGDNILVGGLGDGNSFVVDRFTAAGTLDTTFGTDGTATVQLQAPVIQDFYGLTAMAVQGGQIYLAGSVVSNDDHFGIEETFFAVVRLDTNGNLDASYGGAAPLDLDGRPSVTYNRLATPGWAFVAEGAGDDGSSPGAVLVYSDGQALLDGGTGIFQFSADGRTVEQVGSGLPTPIVQPDGKLLLASLSGDPTNGYYTILTRLNPDLTPDTTFGPNGDGQEVLNVNPDPSIIPGIYPSYEWIPGTYPSIIPGISWIEPGISSVLVQSDGNVVVARDLGYVEENNGDGTIGSILTRVLEQATPGQIVHEGDTVTLTGTAFDPSTVEEPTLAYAWSVTKDGAAYQTATGTSSQFTPTDNGTYVVTLTVTDQGGGSSTDSRTFTVVNAPPTASVTGPATAVAGQVLSYTLSASDPSSVDEAAGFTYTVDWGDGAADSPDVQTFAASAGNGAGLTVTHAYAAAGAYTVLVTATDKDGGVSTAVSTAVQVNAVTASNVQQQLTPGGTVTVQTTTSEQAHDVIAAANDLDPATAPTSTLVVDLGGQTIQDTTLNVPPQVTVQFVNGTFIGGSPALIVSSGVVIVKNSTFQNATDAPTILVTGGNLILRGDTIEESTGYSDAAIEVTGGTVDLGTADDGGNTININDSGAFVTNTTATPIAASGTAFTVNGAPLKPDSLSGIVFEDFNDDGQVDFGEQGIAGVTVTLTGTDFLGNAVSLPATTDSDGAYVFANLLPGTYSITETQPTGYNQGVNAVGSAGGSLSATDQFFVSLAQDAIALNGMNYNFGEQPQASGSVQKGQTAGIGFWNNKNGQALIKALPVVTNADGSVTSLANWLAATLPHMFGVNAGSNNLAGKSNADIAALFQSDFLVKGVKLDAQVLATALSVYATNATLDDTRVAANYGFTVSGDGVGTAGVNVGSDGDAFGVANNTVLTVMDLLKRTDAQAVDGLLYNGDAVKRKEANSVYGAINDAGS